MVISASWLSRTGEGDGTLNLRGVATVLSLAGFLKSQFHLNLSQPTGAEIEQNTLYGRRI